MTKKYFNKSLKTIIELNPHAVRQMREKAESLRTYRDKFIYLNYIEQEVKVYVKYSNSCERFTIKQLLTEFQELDDSYNLEIIDLLYEQK